MVATRTAKAAAKTEKVRQLCKWPKLNAETGEWEFAGGCPNLARERTARTGPAPDYCEEIALADPDDPNSRKVKHGAGTVYRMVSGNLGADDPNGTATFGDEKIRQPFTT